MKNTINLFATYRLARRAVSTVAAVAGIIASISSCSFLDVVPDDVVTVDHAFENMATAERYLATCYHYIPEQNDPGRNTGMMGGDEVWTEETNYRPFDAQGWNVARGLLSAALPVNNYWDQKSQAGSAVPSMYKAIRDCNVFIENVSDMNKIPDLRLDRRVRWIAEVKVLKAYYHFILLRQYGPIPFIDENLPISTDDESVRLARTPVDVCVEKITALIDEAAPDLPPYIVSTGDELGRITLSTALAIKAKVLLMAASPLFNGNTEMAALKNRDGEQLFNQSYDVNKWVLAADAALAAINAADAVGAKLYYFSDYNFSQGGMTQLSLRNAVCEKWNPEIIWGLSGRNVAHLQQVCMAVISQDIVDNSRDPYGLLAPPLKIVQQFYSKNGVPVEEDRTLDFTVIDQLRTATAAESNNIETGYTTARINFDRESRFYAYLGFDGGKWLMDAGVNSESNASTLKCKMGQIGRNMGMSRVNVTGYFVKKWTYWKSSFGQSWNIRPFPWPEIRLADLYLMYAEALNEAEGPVQDVHTYINMVRARAGLDPVTEAWKAYSRLEDKPSTQAGMREIIHRERLIELAFEGSRFWDLRRWKEAPAELNSAITGWDVFQSDAATYYQARTIYNQSFVAPRDYFWPISLKELETNNNLVQNLGW